MRDKRILNKYELLTLIATCIKAVTAILGASVILTEQRPLITLLVLSVGAIANEVVSFLKTKDVSNKNKISG